MNNMLPTPYQQFIHKSRYARWIDEEDRRENWDETVERYLKFMIYQVKGKHRLTCRRTTYRTSVMQS